MLSQHLRGGGEADGKQREERSDVEGKIRLNPAMLAHRPNVVLRRRRGARGSRCIN
jgi:hypothetical protein